MQGLLGSMREDLARRERQTCGALEASLPCLPCRSCGGMQPAVKLVLASDVPSTACAVVESARGWCKEGVADLWCPGGRSAPSALLLLQRIVASYQACDTL